MSLRSHDTGELEAGCVRYCTNKVAGIVAKSRGDRHGSAGGGADRM